MNLVHVDPRILKNSAFTSTNQRNHAIAVFNELISENPGKQALYLGEDFASLIAKINVTAPFDEPDGEFGDETVFVDNVYMLTVYFNVFLLAFGINTLRICYEHEGSIITLKTVSLNENLNSDEKEIISYLKGFLKDCKRLDADRNLENPDFGLHGHPWMSEEFDNYNFSDTEVGQSMIERKASLFRSRGAEYLRNDDGTIDRSESILEKFDDLVENRHGIFLYKTTGYEYAWTAEQSAPLRFTSNFHEVANLVNIYDRRAINDDGDDIQIALEEERESDNIKFFRKMCFSLIKEKIDPMQVFINSNLINPVHGKASKRELSDLEKKLIASFFLATDIPLTVIEDAEAVYPSYIKDGTGLSNHKKLVFDLQMRFHGINETLNPDKIKIVLSNFTTKRGSVLGQENFSYSQPISVSSQWHESLNSGGRRSRRSYNLGDMPTIIINKNTPFTREALISLEQYKDQNTDVYTCSRVVSDDAISALRSHTYENFNGHFNGYKLSVLSEDGPVVTRYAYDASGKFALNRNIIINTSSFETQFVSSVTFDPKIGNFIPENSRIDSEIISNVRVFGFCVSNIELGIPLNEIRIYNIPEGALIERVEARSELSPDSFELPFVVDERSRIIHSNPIPNIKYNYQIYVKVSHDRVDSHIFETTIMTLNYDFLKIRLSNPQVLIDADTKIPSVVVLLETTQLEEYRTNTVNKMLNDLYPVTLDDSGNPNSRERDTFADAVQAKLNEDLETIGNSFELFVQFFDKESGELIDYDYFSSSLEGDDYVFSFEAPEANRDIVMCHNLLINNPLHDVLDVVEIVEDRVNSRERYLRNTSKYFNSLSRSTSTIGTLVEREGQGGYVYSVNNKLNPEDKFNRVVCTGAITDIPGIHRESYYPFDMFEVEQIVQTGEFILRWEVSKGYNNISNSVTPDFFVISACVYDLPRFGNKIAEFPITACPYVCDNACVSIMENFYRTFSFTGIAKYVSFKIYTVYNDFTIDSISAESEIMQVNDLRLSNKVVA